MCENWTSERTSKQTMNKASFDKVSKSFGAGPVLSEISFELKQGGRYGLVGPNGAGKSTLLRLLAGELAPTRGLVLVNGSDPGRHPESVRSRLGLLPEGAPLMVELTAEDHLRLAANLKGLSREQWSKEEERLTRSLGLQTFYRHPAGILSHGQKRRVALASALLGQPDFLILDEPTSGLDPAESHGLLKLLTSLADTTTLLISSHILGEVYHLTREVLVLTQGSLVAFAPWGELLGTKTADEDSLKLLFFQLTGSGDKS